METAPAVAILLVTYSGAKCLDRLYPSICRLRYPRERYSLLVIENGPERDSARWFAERAPHVRVIVPGENTGYAGGNALGMSEAIASGVDYVAVITQDTELDQDWLRELVDVGERYPAVGAIQPKILRRDAHGQPVINSWGNELHFLGIGYPGGDGLPDRPLEIRRIPYASGAGLLYRVRALQTVGVFDPAFFMYHEDTDLSWRMRLAGYDVLLAPRAVMSHDYGFKRSVDKFYYIERNRLINLLTHYRLRTLALLGPALLLFELFALGYALREGWFLKRLAVYGFLLRPGSCAYLSRKRRWVQSVRRIPDRAIVGNLTGRIEFGPIDSLPVRRVVNPLLDLYWRFVRPLIVW
ncbi:MAG: glycosyltransferase family 2 protein [Candidatus Methylomirabilia bacterium]